MRALAVATLVLSACSSGPGNVDPQDPDGGGVIDLVPDAAPTTPTDECGDLRAKPRVFYGTESPTYLPMTPGQVMAIGTFGGCSGTLITPTWVLTAAHCGLNASAEFCIGATPGNANVCFDATRALDNPSGDMTLVELDRDARELAPDVIPIAIFTEEMDASWIGRTAEAAGYGQTETGDYGTRLFTAEPIVMLSGDTLTVDGEGMRGVCFGDSGGPVMVIAADGTVRVAGDLSNGDESCVGQDNFTRVDVHRAWIEGYTGPTIVDGAACGAIDVVGRCLNGTAMWCGDGDVLATDACDGGSTCGWDGAANGYRCVAGADPCGGVDGFGVCDGQVARWCDAGEPRQRDCAACMQLCVTDVAAGGATCADDPCMGLDYLGRCTGDVAEWCDNGQLQSEDCAARGQTCGWVNDEIGYYCM